MDVLRQPIAQELALWPSFQAAKLSVQDIARALVRPPKRDMGDVALGCFVFAKAAGIKPNEMAAKLASSVEVGENNIKGASPGAAELVASATAAGPYVNLKLNRAAAIEQVLSAIEGTCPGNDAQTWSFGGSDEGKGKTLVLDFSSPNIAKPLAVHHLRSTMIGNSIKKIRESQGWRVVGINHLGDWGTGFGKMIAGLKTTYPELRDPTSQLAMQRLRELSIDQVNAAYKAANAESDEKSAAFASGKEEFAELERLAREFEALSTGQGAVDQWFKLQGASNYQIWVVVRNKSLREFERIYAKLGLRFINWVDDRRRDVRGLNEKELRQAGLYFGEADCARIERIYPDFVENCSDWGIAEKSDGAVVIFTHGRKRAPLMLQKNDGATTYALRDMTAAKYRNSIWGTTPANAGPHSGGTAIPFQMAYVVGGEQKLHFEQLFAALQMWEDADPNSPSPKFDWKANCSHVDFGLLLFKQPDGKWAKASTRKGRVIMLEDLLDEAIAAVKEIMSEKNPELSGSAASEEIAQKVGVGAVVFNDLKNGRRNDIKFDWDEILNFQGETGPYMLMQYVRMGSVSEKFAQVYPHLTWAGGDVSKLARDDEFELALLLAGFPEAMRRASAEYEPSNVAKALIEIAAQTSSWWTNTKDTRIVGDDAELSRARVRLVNAIRKVLGRGLLLLGISLVERM